MKLKPPTEHADEYDLHSDVAKWLRENIGGRVTWWHTPNAARRRGRTAGQLKNKGVLSGVPDFSFVIPPNGRAAYIELKTTEKRSKPNPNQIAFAEKVKMDGALYAVCRSLAEVQGVLSAWGVRVTVEAA